MRKKDILGNFVQNHDVLYKYTLKKVRRAHEPEAYTALITFLPGSRQLIADYDGEKVCLAGPGYRLLMYLPMDQYWKIAIPFDPQDKLLEWYFDISRGNFVDESGMPCIDDIFLDLEIWPDGRNITLDADELQEALDRNEITKADFDHAYRVHDQIKNSLWGDVEYLQKFSHKLFYDHIIGDIPAYESFTHIEPVIKGWSGAKKYAAETADGQKYLLRIVDAAHFDRKKIEYEMMGRVYEAGVLTSKPVDFGLCGDGESCYTLSGWINGTDVENALPHMSEAEQYLLGVKAGETLRKIHTLPPSQKTYQNQTEWEIHIAEYAKSLEQKYNGCGVSFDGDRQALAFILQTREKMQYRPACARHSDAHVGNMMIKNGEIYVIDYDMCDEGDPWEELSTIVLGATYSPHFATGQVRGYFGGEPPQDFWPQLAFYIAANMFWSICWAAPVGQMEIDYYKDVNRKIMAWYDNFDRTVPSWYADFHAQRIDGIPCKLKKPFDFSFLRKYGTVFKIYDDQDSGNICFGVQKDAEKYFVKFAGAPTVRSNVSAEEAVARMKTTAQIYHDLAHPALTRLVAAEETGGGYATVFAWFDGECMGRQYPESRARFMQMPVETRLRVFDAILSFHAHVARQGYVAIDFYDGCIMYDFANRKTMLCDIEVYAKAPYINTMGRMWGSSRFMSPEEFTLGAVIDEITNVYTMGATAFSLFGEGGERTTEKWMLNPALYDVAQRAVSDDRAMRQQSVAQFIAEWESGKC